MYGGMPLCIGKRSDYGKMDVSRIPPDVHIDAVLSYIVDVCDAVIRDTESAIADLKRHENIDIATKHIRKQLGRIEDMNALHSDLVAFREYRWKE